MGGPVVTTAREKAEAWYPVPAANATVTELNTARKSAFMAGAEWQAQQPVEITDEMVERAATSDYAFDGFDPWSSERSMVKDHYRHRSRAALEAALGAAE